MKRIVVFLFVFAALTAGAFQPRGAVLFPVKAAYAEEGSKEEAAKKEEGDHKTEGEGTGKKKPDFEYVELDALTMPVMTVRGVTQQVSFIISLEVPFGMKGDVAVYKPRLADAYIQDLYGAFGAGVALINDSNIVDILTVKKRLASVTDRVLGPDLKASVLLQVVRQSRI